MMRWRAVDSKDIRNQQKPDDRLEALLLHRKRQWRGTRALYIT
jgi:hypothetical protein